MTRSRFTRRRYLAGGSALGLAALAGCTDGRVGEDDSQEGPGDEAPEEEDTADAQEGEQLENNESAEGQNPDDQNESNESNESDAGNVENIDYENTDGDVSFVQPEDGEEVSSPVAIEAEVENFELRPAEEEEAEQGAGHLHVIVDQGCLQPEYAIPQEEGYHHLSEGETTTELDLEPGEHDLCLQASDAMHLAYDMTDEISITVADGEGGNETDGNESGDGNETDDNESDGNATDDQ